MTNNQILEFKTYLINEEKSKATIEKYIRDAVACMMTEEQLINFGKI